MKLKDVSTAKKIMLFSLVLISTISFGFMVYAFVYAPPGSINKENSFLIGLGFMVVTRSAVLFYRHSIIIGE